ncbi:MAG: capsule assembly Wzi family protein [Stenotrophobium sp.]
MNFRPRKAATGFFLLAFVIVAFQAEQAFAQSAWAQVGDRTLRSDIEILAAHGLITNLVTTWPIPAGQLKSLADDPRLEKEPEFVRLAASRVLAHLSGPKGAGVVTGVVDARATNSPDIVRDFGTLARNQADIRAGLDWNTDDVGANLRVGVQSRFSGQQKIVSWDGSDVSGVWDNVKFYGGWVDQWYGPGWDSSLILSNNARPFPKIGLMRDNPQAFETPWLSWLGPWQANFFIGLLDGPRIATDSLMGSLRLTFAPVHGLEIALTRMTEFCGKGHPCNFINAAFHFNNSDSSTNEANEEATIEFKGTANFGNVTLSPYVQFMNEDTGPFAHSITSYLAGSSVVGQVGTDGAQWRFTAEYADTVPTMNLLDFGSVAHGDAYNNYSYTDGFRYRDRTLGFSLDSDSHLISLIGQITDAQGWTYRAVYHHASVSTPQLAQMQSAGGQYNVVSSVPITFDQVELGLTIPYRWFTIDFGARGQDALPVPVYGSRGDKLAAEIGIQYKF